MRNPSKSFEDLIVWKKAHQFVLSVYKITDQFPRREFFGLTNQFRRAAVSVAANIAEGFKKRGKSDKIRFYNIAQGSLEECKYFLILSRDLHYYEEEKAWNLSVEVTKLLEAYIASLE